jgi:hypothetical protein
MRKVMLVVLSVLSLVLGSAAIADAAAKPAYKVSLVTSVATSTGGGFITVSGKVTGPKAAGKTVTIQRHYVGGPWVTVATATINSHGRYKARVETPRGGTTSFRALKAKSSVRKAGVSPTRSLPVFEWLYLANQPAKAQTNDYQSGLSWLINGKTYARTVIFTSDNSLIYKLGGLCTRLSTVADYQYTSSPPPPASVDFAIGVLPFSGPPVTNSTQVATGAAKSFNVSLTGGRLLQLAVSNFDSSYGLVLGDPQVYCNADQLPSWNKSDFVP